MRRVSDGYTLIEVLIFIFVSAIILFSAILVFSGREDSARFTQSMRDVQSKFQDWINDVSTGYPGTTKGDTRCFVTGSHGGKRVHINKASMGDPPNSPDCIFLGKIIEVLVSPYARYNAGESNYESRHIWAYPVFASRLNDSGELVSSLSDDAAPTPAIGPDVGDPGVGSGTATLTENYALEGSTKVIGESFVVPSGYWSYQNNIVLPNGIVGFFNSFNTQQNTSSNGAEQLNLYQYHISNSLTEVNFNTHKEVYNCVTRAPGVCFSVNPPNSFNTWKICFANDDNDQTAVLTVTSSNGLGASVSLAFRQCSQSVI